MEVFLDYDEFKNRVGELAVEGLSYGIASQADSEDQRWDEIMSAVRIGWQTIYEKQS